MNKEMKQYTGTKKVKAKPMTMGEAYERKLLKEGVRPSECETDKAGYLVEYPDGYQSWSPADVFEKAYSPSETILERMTIEYFDLDNKVRAYTRFLNSEMSNNIYLTTIGMLTAQVETMKEYLSLLNARALRIMKNGDGHKGFSLGVAIKYLKAGMAVRRAGWNGKGMFIVKQVPAHITGDIIPGMQSLPQSAKDIIMARKEPHIDYTNQMLIINPDGRADSWVPSSSDVFAEDWELVTE